MIDDHSNSLYLFKVLYYFKVSWMMTDQQRLRAALKLNAYFSALCTVFLMFGANMLAPHFGLPGTQWLYALAAGLAIFVLMLVMLIRRGRVEETEAWVIVAADAAWVVGSLVLAILYHASMSPVGLALLLLVAAAVLYFALRQFRALRGDGAPAVH